MSENSLRERLLEKEPRSPELEAKYREEITKMMEKKLTLAQKVGWIFSVVLGLLFAVVFGYATVASAGKLPLLATALFGVGAFSGGAEVVFSLWILRRGSFHLRSHENAINGMVAGLMVICFVSVLFLADQLEDRIGGVDMILRVLGFVVIFGVPALISLRINQTEMVLREQLLRTELKLAELAEKMERD